MTSSSPFRSDAGPSSSPVVHSSPGPNGKPLSYTPRQHRRISSNLSLDSRDITPPPGQSGSSSPHPASPGPLAGSFRRLQVATSDSGTAPPSTSRSERAAGTPPPLRRLKPPPTTTTTTTANGHPPSSSSSSLAGTLAQPIALRPADRSSSARPSLAVQSTANQGPSTSPSSSPGSSTHLRSPSLPTTSGPPPTQLPNQRRRNEHARSQTATNIPSQFAATSKFTLPAAKAISTSQALRLRELQEQDQSNKASGTSSASAQSSRGPSPLSVKRPTEGLPASSSTAMSGFDAMYAAQQQQQQQQRSNRVATAPNPARAAFQPRGVSRSQLPEFLDLKRAAKAKQRAKNGGQDGEDVARHEERIRRRVEKLLAIHDPDSSEILPLPSSNRVSFRSSLLTTLAPHSRFLSNLQVASSIRAQEQALVPWQPDEAATHCRLCQKAFAVNRRKHHCRSCGLLVCASPEMSTDNSNSITDVLTATQQQKCSSLVIRDEGAVAADGSDGPSIVIKDVPSEAGLEALLNQASKGDTQAQALTSLATQQSGFRICRQCKNIALKGQYMSEENEKPEWIRLYESLMTMQKEIEQSLPEFQELIMGLQKQDTSSALGVSSPPSSPTAGKQSDTAQLQLQRDAAIARKALLANFANYDAIARKIKALPDGGNVSLQRIKDNVERAAGAFLRANMFPLQSLPKLNNESKHKRTASAASSTAATPAADPALQVLYEQRDQIAGFLKRAQQERKLNDVVLLKQNLDELEGEIARRGGTSRRA